MRNFRSFLKRKGFVLTAICLLNGQENLIRFFNVLNAIFLLYLNLDTSPRISIPFFYRELLILLERKVKKVL